MRELKLSPRPVDRDATEMLLRQVAVEFPDGSVRNVEAEYVDHDILGFNAHRPGMGTIRNLTPVDQPGWLFKQMVGGKWLAFRTLR